MKQPLNYLTAAVLCTLPSIALAASAPAGSAPADPLSAAGILAMGIGFIILAIVLYLSFFAIFVHVATGMVGLSRPFSTAFYAVVLNIAFQFLFSIVVSMFTRSDGAFLLASWGSACASIMVAYKAGFFQALGAAVLTVILTVVFFVVAVLVLLAVFAGSAPVRG